MKYFFTANNRVFPRLIQRSFNILLLLPTRQKDYYAYTFCKFFCTLHLFTSENLIRLLFLFSEISLLSYTSVVVASLRYREKFSQQTHPSWFIFFVPRHITVQNSRIVKNSKTLSVLQLKKNLIFAFTNTVIIMD